MIINLSNLPQSIIFSCNMCGEKFEPPRPSASSLPNARKHVVLVHKKTHLRYFNVFFTQKCCQQICTYLSFNIEIHKTL